MLVRSVWSKRGMLAYVVDRSNIVIVRTSSRCRLTASMVVQLNNKIAWRVSACPLPLGLVDTSTDHHRT